MAVNIGSYLELTRQLQQMNVSLVAVSKTKPVEDIHALYNLGQRDFGENYVQELTEKQRRLPADIRWHFIGHLQSNKIKYIIPFVHLIHGVDSYKLLGEINRQAKKNNRITACLLQVHIAREETKFGFDPNELEETMNLLSEGEFRNVVVKGLMGMASFTDDVNKVRDEFRFLRSLFEKYRPIKKACCDVEILSMGMSSDYETAIQEGSNMVRIGSLLFGARK